MPKIECAFVIRSADESDYDEIADIWHSSASLEGVGPPVMPTIAELRARIDLEVECGWLLSVAVSNENTIAFLAIKPNEAVLDQLFVRPDVLGSGVGQALMLEAMKAMPEGFTLHTASTNKRARRFYEKSGMLLLRDGLHPRTGHPVSYYYWEAG